MRRRVIVSPTGCGKRWRPFSFVVDYGRRTEIAVTISAGVMANLDAAGSEEALIHAADRALHAAKHRGRNCTVMYEASKQELQAERAGGLMRTSARQASCASGGWGRVEWPASRQSTLPVICDDSSEMR